MCGTTNSNLINNFTFFLKSHLLLQKLYWQFGLGWLVGSGEPCFQRRPILYFMNYFAFTLPLQGYVPRPFISIGIRSRSSQQSVLEARTLPLSYQGRAVWSRIKHEKAFFSSFILKKVVFAKKHSEDHLKLQTF